MKLSHMAVTAALLLGLAPLTHAQNIVQNGGFETGGFTDWTIQIAGAGSQYGTSTASHSGHYYAVFESTGATPFVDDDRISQVLPTVVGDTYTLDFFVEDFGASLTDFRAIVNGDALLTLLNPSPFAWTEFSYNFVGTGSDTLTFGARANTGHIGLDDISVIDQGSEAATPEPGCVITLGSLGLAGVGVLRRTRSRK